MDILLIFLYLPHLGMKELIKITKVTVMDSSRL